MFRFIGKHWRGRYPLLTSMLGIGVICVGLAIGTLRLLNFAAAQLEMTLAFYASVELLRYICCIAILAWAAIGIWRSAARESWRKRWLARAALALSGMMLLPFGIASAKSGKELLALALNRDPLGPPASVQLSGSSIELDGPIAQGSADRLIAALATHSKVRTVALSSIGGRVTEAEKIASAIDARKLDTFVLDDCFSACTDILLAGRRRSAAADARIGFHQATMDGNGALDDKLISEAGRDRYLRAGIDPKFVDKAFSTRASDLWIPSSEELIRAGVLTSVEPPGRSR